MNIWDLLPQSPFLGPPLPRFLNLYWPWAQPASSATSTSPLAGLFRGADDSRSSVAPQIMPQSMPAYENREEIEFPDGFDPETLMPRKIVVHRKYKMRVE